VRRVRVRIHGHVQGVFFRDSCRREASRLGVSGWVGNESDGTVAGEFEGDSVDALVDWCRSGPPGAQVERVEVDDVEPTGERGFAVR